MKRKKVALVLSGGATLGFAHVGVIKVLQKYNIPIDIVVGTSMGGLVGAGYAVGLSVEEMTNFACKFKNIDMFDINFTPGGFFSGRGMMRSITKFLPDIKIEDLSVKYACVACDLITEKEIIFREGSIRDAVRSTVSIPGLLVPHRIKSMRLVDGGVVNNLPDSIAKEMGADVIISCDVLKNYQFKKKNFSLLTSLLASINAMTKTMQSFRPNYSDVVIEPDLDCISQMNFSKKSALVAIEIGEKETEKHIKEILKLLE